MQKNYSNLVTALRTLRWSSFFDVIGRGIYHQKYRTPDDPACSDELRSKEPNLNEITEEGKAKEGDDKMTLRK